MSIQVEVPGGVAEFPDEMSPDEIKSVLQKKFPATQKAAPAAAPQIPNPFEKIEKGVQGMTPMGSFKEAMDAAQGNGPKFDFDPNKSLFGIDPANVPSGAGTRAPAITIPASALARGAAGVGKFITSPSGLLQMVAAATPAAPLVYAKWTYDMLKGGKEAAQDAGKRIGDVGANLITQAMASQMNPSGAASPGNQENIQALAEDVVNVALLGTGVAHTGSRILQRGPPLAGAVKEPARTTSEVSAEATGKPAKSASLTAEEQAYLDTERKGIEAPIEVVEDLPEGQPFSKQIATVDRKSGKILINPSEFSAWLKTVPPERRALATRSLLDEEGIHLKVGDEDAAAYWNTLTAAEKAINKRRYTGSWRGRAPGGGEISDTMFGHEALRFRLQQLSRMTPREIAEAATKERWTLNAITAMESAIRTARQALGTKASGTQLAIVGRMSENLDRAKAALGGSPAAIGKQRTEEAEQAAKELGVNFRPASALDPNSPAIKQMPPEQQQALADLARQYGWEFTNPKTGITFYTPEGSSKETILARAKAKSEEPGAIRKRPTKDVNQVDFFLPPVTKEQVEPRATSAESGALPSKITPQFIQEQASQHLQTSERPSFSSFAEDMKRNHGNVQPGQLRELWEDSVWKRVLRASGADLAKLRDSLKLGRQLGDRPIADAPGEKGFTLERQPEGELKGLVAEEEKGAHNRQKYRSLVASRVGEKLISESYKEEAPLNRSQVAPDDLGYGRASKQPVFNEIGSELSDVPKVLGRVLTADSGVDRTGAGAPPVSVTRRVTAMMDKRSGKVHLVSTYYDGRRGAVLLDPAAPRGEHIRLESMLQRYRPIASLLLDEPVQNFHQRFDSLTDFNERLGGEARNRSQMGDYGFPGESSTQPVAPIEGSEGIHGEGGMVTGPLAEQGRAELGIGRGSIMERERLTDAEAGAVLDHLYDEVGKLESASDVRNAVAGLSEAFKNDQLSPRDWQTINGYRKVYEVLRRKWPQLTEEQVLDQVYDEIYAKAKGSENREAFTQDLLQSYRGRRPEDVRSGAPAGAESGRELTTLRSTAPTTDPGISLPKGPGPEPQLPPPRPPEMLSPEAQAYVARRAAAEYPTMPKVIYSQLAHRQVPKERYSMGAGPGAIRKAQDTVAKDYERTRAAIGAAISRGTTKQDIVRFLDGAESAADKFAANAGKHVELASTREMGLFGKKSFKGNVEEARKVRAAAKAVLWTAGKDAQGKITFDVNKLTAFNGLLAKGEVEARQWASSLNPTRRHFGKRWLEEIEKSRAEIKYAQDHWNNPELQKTAEAAHQEFADAFTFANQNGSSLQERADYIPGRYEGEFWSDSTINFGGLRILGTSFRSPKTFRNGYEALAAGPYLPVSRDLADLVSHNVRQIHKIANRHLWQEGLKSMTDPESKKPVAIDPTPVLTDREFTDPETKETFTAKVVSGWKSSDPNYKLVYPTSKQRPVAVRAGYEKLIRTITEPSHIEDYPMGKEALRFTQAIKHNVLLVWDTFHLGRVAQYALAAMGLKNPPKYRGGLSALMYREGDLADAVSKGYVSNEDAKWATEPVEFLKPDGTKAQYSRSQVLGMMVKQGLNAAKITDALYREAGNHLPIVGKAFDKILGPYNRWLFDKFMPGLISDSAVRTLEKFHKANPKTPLPDMVRDVVRDVNAYYGNMGRQGVFKSATLRDVAQILLLAPMWREGLYQKDAKFLARTARMPARLIQSGLQSAGMERAAGAAGKLAGRQGLPSMGFAGGAVARGLIGYMALTQMINLITRGHLTFQNKEEGHKFDAWIPLGKDSGLWLSPMSVFGEVTHDLIRLSEKKPKVWDAITQMGENMLGPIGKMEQVLRTGRNPAGEQITTTAGVLKTALAQLAPAPISLGTPLRAIGHAVAPGAVSPTKPGELEQRMMGMAGIKVERSRTQIQQMQDLARQWMKSQGLENQMMAMIPTDEPSYSKLRTALQNGDQKTAKATLTALRQGHTDQQILKAMQDWAARPLTGSHEHERVFLSTLPERQLEDYFEALLAKQTVYEGFVEWYLQQSQREDLPSTTR